MLKKRLEIIFSGITIIALLVLGKNYYDSYIYKSSDISDNYKQLILDKEQEILKLMYLHYGFSFKVPLIITDKLKGRLYGLTSYKNTKIKIYLNKKVMRESMDYVLNSVIAHEYAHALIFKLGSLQHKDDGHSLQWQKACVNLGGINCQRYVNTHDVIMDKMPF